MSKNSGIQPTCNSTLTLQLTLGNLLKLSVPQFLSFENGWNNNTYLLEVVVRIKWDHASEAISRLWLLEMAQCLLTTTLSLPTIIIIVIFYYLVFTTSIWDYYHLQFRKGVWLLEIFWWKKGYTDHWLFGTLLVSKWY